jgi:electron transport complex protein RnfD
LGKNLFNPAMVGYAVLIVSFPLAMSDWTTPVNFPQLSEAMFDGVSAATPLDEFKFRGALTVDEFWQQSGETNWFAWLLINAGFLTGGLYLLATRVCTWMAPVSMLTTITLLSILFYDSGSSGSFGSPLFQLFSGATMMGAFFIVTDPVTSPDSFRGQFIFGVGVGLLTFIIRNYGAYPEGLAFAVLLMNGCSPLIDHIEFRLHPARAGDQ